MFVEWWQHLPERMNPYIIDVGFFRIHWYGLMYVVAAAVVYLLVSYRIRRREIPFTSAVILDAIFWGVLGLFIGARIGYVLIYNAAYFFRHPLEIIGFSLDGGFHLVGFAGMSYHGGLIGATIAIGLFLRSRRINFWDFSDALIPALPLGYTFGRLGNFINGELYGRETTSPLGMYFPGASGTLRHPSQLYEAVLEGILIFIILWFVRNAPKLRGTLFGWYIILYAATRFVVEYWREPDTHLGLILGPFSMGQVLSILMLITGVVMVAIRIDKSKWV